MLLRLRFISEYGRLLMLLVIIVQYSHEGSWVCSKQIMDFLSEFYEYDLFLGPGHLLSMIQRLLVTSQIIRCPTE